MSFNFSNKYDFPPELNLGGENLQVVREQKILGFLISDLKWNVHIKYICKKAKRRVWDVGAQKDDATGN